MGKEQGQKNECRKKQDFSSIDAAKRGPYALEQSLLAERAMSTSTETDSQPTAYVIARRFRRITLPKGMLVAWYGGGDQRVSRVKTLGMGGLFVAEPNAPVVGSILRLSFEVPGGSVHVEAVVRNVTPGEGMGLEFTRLNTRDRVLMEILLRRCCS